MAPVFSGDQLQHVIRWAFLANGFFCLLGGIGYVLEIDMLVFFCLNLGMGGAILVATAALALFFRRQMAARLALSA